MRVRLNLWTSSGRTLSSSVTCRLSTSAVPLLVRTVRYSPSTARHRFDRATTRLHHSVREIAYLPSLRPPGSLAGYAVLLLTPFLPTPPRPLTLLALRISLSRTLKLDRLRLNSSASAPPSHFLSQESSRTRSTDFRAETQPQEMHRDLTIRNETRPRRERVRETARRRVTAEAVI